MLFLLKILTYLSNSERSVIKRYSAKVYHIFNSIEILENSIEQSKDEFIFILKNSLLKNIYDMESRIFLNILRVNY